MENRKKTYEIQAEEVADITLQACYRIPDWLSIPDNILKPLNRKAGIPQIIIARKKLVLMGLIEEKNPDDADTPVRITSKGFFAIEMYGTLEKYQREEKKLQLADRDIRYLQEQNIRLKNLNLTIGIASFIIGNLIGGLAGLLLSNPIKNILRQWMEGG